MDIVANGVRFNVLHLSQGDQDHRTWHRPTPVVFLHGLIRDNLSSFYFTLAPSVGKRTEAVLYDLRGHGRSERPTEGYRIEDGVADLIALLDTLGIHEPVHLVGNSYGGALALAAAVTAPERVAGLVLIESHLAFEGWGDAMSDELSEFVVDVDRLGIGAHVDEHASRRVRKMVRTCVDLIERCSLDADLRSSTPTREEDLAHLSCPTLLLYGADSDLVDRGVLLERLIPGAELRGWKGIKAETDKTKKP